MQQSGRREGPRGRPEEDSVAQKIAGELESLPKMADLDAEQLVKYGYELGEHLARQVKLKTTQIRKFLDAVNEISAESMGKSSVRGFQVNENRSLKNRAGIKPYS